jgi:tripartite-type tricarboxylate transporter receptor subunit TctC
MRAETDEQAIVALRRRGRSVKVPEASCGASPRRRANDGTTWKKTIALAIIILGFLALVQPTQAQEYPTQPITMLISMTPGSGVDVCARVIAQGASKILGQEIIPVNKPGGGGAVGTGILVSSKADGYTFLASSSSTFTVVPHLESVTYDPLKDVVPILHYGTTHCAIIVRADSPYKSFKDLIDFARKNPGKVSIGVVGIGNVPHLDIELVMQQEKVDMPVIPFGGAAPTVTALLGGHVTAAGVGTAGWMPNFKAGKVRVLATTTEKRIIPDVPALREFGYPFNDISTDYYVMLAPKGTPAAAIKKLEGALQAGRSTPEFRKTIENFFVYDPNPLSSEEIKDRIERLFNINGQMIRKAKLGKQG